MKEAAGEGGLEVGLLMTAADQTRRRVPGQITAIAWIYIVFGAGLFAACLANARVGQFALSIADLWFPVFLIVAAAGAILRKPWGRWSCYVFSGLMLVGVPIGTIIGGLMIYNLTVHRNQFH